ncbi:flagellar basal body-associated FliL family protein [Roseovarius sp. M141]|uniref:flagellar basal body-associated FliL family protein n=1 Tax=Roseovarius sp. M141 TaxID=2583806 RepID=UPI0020CECC6E|nr:flagellar basal body-associated FliL family protein [Roseovarius sp. M141]MCQ0091829.1 flagellar basal body-associated FliL family protein [Roseovarius sp. M141]
MRLLIPLILLLVGLGGGVGAGLALRPTPEAAALPPGKGGKNEAGVDAHATPSGTHSAAKDYRNSNHGGDTADNLEYIKLNNQFVVPIVTKDDVEAIIVMSLSLEIAAGQSETVYQREPKLRDEFLSVLFDHANMGGFRGTFTDTGKLSSLRNGLFSVAKNTLGPIVTAVLITDIARQDL